MESDTGCQSLEDGGGFFLDGDGNIVGKKDFFQSGKQNISTPVSKDTIWIDEIKVPEDILGKVRSVAVCIYLKNNLLKVDRGARDWNDRRFLIDFPSSLPIDG